MAHLLTTTSAVVVELGGTKAVAELTGWRETAVSNWRREDRGTFPPETYLVLSQALERRGKRAPASLWKMVPPADPDPSTQEVAA